MKVILPIIAFLFTHCLFLNVAYSQEDADSVKVKQDTQIDTIHTLAKNPPRSNNSVAKEVFVIVEKMPRFPGCNESENEKDLKCSQKLLEQYISEHLVYPNLAIDEKVEGTVIVQFIVSKSGELLNLKCIRDIGAGCGEEAIRLVRSMPDWIPGSQRGTSVEVRYNLPINFKLSRQIKSKRKRN